MRTLAGEQRRDAALEGTGDVHDRNNGDDHPVQLCSFHLQSPGIGTHVLDGHASVDVILC